MKVFRFLRSPEGEFGYCAKASTLWLIVVLGLPLTVGTAVRGNVILGGDFGAAFGDHGWDNSSFGGTSADIGSDGFLIDDGWVTYDHSTASTFSPAWEVVGGVASRTANTQYQFGGLAQMLSNPANGSFDNGDTVAFSFDYLMNSTGGLSAGVWGVTAPNGTSATWNLFAGESIAGLGQANVAIGATDFTSGTDYQFYNLAYFEDTTASAAAANHSVSFTLSRDYAYFVVGFQGDPNGGGAGLITLDNVSLAAAGVPEPTRTGLCVWSVCAFLLRRSRT